MREVMGSWLRRAGLAALLVAAPAPAVAPPWWDSAQIRVKVHEHAFHRATANGAGCAVRLRLYFEAPAAAYAEGASERNHYNFQANVLFSDGSRFSTAVFDNTQPGARVYAFTHDTTSQGCWAEHPHSLRKVDVHACRGERCVPEPFE